ncbi:MAG TPA: alpha/beta hydrolase [Pirellulales bacterium]|nr:alpha/beta hydrolase [Pirellulales bacterium]
MSNRSVFSRCVWLCLGVIALSTHLARAQQKENEKQKPKPATNAQAEPTYADVSYGPAARNVLDFYQAAGDQPAPLLIYIHGGGFVAGDKRQGISPVMIQVLKQAGVHFAAINYRFVDGKEVLFPTPQLDGARAVQFLRSKAGAWKIDPKRLACFGGSAGAGISLWIGFHDDLADPDNADPVLRQSTRISAVGSIGGQPTYDPIKIRELIGGRAWEHPSIVKVYGLKNIDEALHPTPAQQRLYDESSAITWLTKDDPPVFMVYNEADGPLPADAKPGQGIHHPNFGRMLKERMDELGIENVFVNQSADKDKAQDANRQMLEFLRRHLGLSTDRKDARE